MIENDVLLHCCFEFGIQRENVFKDWTIPRPSVLKVKHPLDCGEVFVFRNLTAHAQAGRRVVAGDCPQKAARLGFHRCSFPLPFGKELRSIASAINKREGQSPGFADEMSCYKLAAQLQLCSRRRRGGGVEAQAKEDESGHSGCDCATTLECGPAAASPFLAPSSLVHVVNRTNASLLLHAQRAQPARYWRR